MKRVEKEGLSLGQTKKNTHKPKKRNNNKAKRTLANLFSVTFLGVRGTIPTPSKSHLKYGGNTSCVEVTSIYKNKAINILFDAGTGIINYGEEALERGIRVFHLFLTHMHYDHIIGLTRFTPLFREDCEIHIYGQSKSGRSLKKIIEDFFISPFFPIEFHELPSKKTFISTN